MRSCYFDANTFLSRILLIFIAIGISDCAVGATYYGKFSPQECSDFEVSKGSDNGEGILRYCDNGKDQLVYHSGELDIGDTDKTRYRDLRAINKVRLLMQKRSQGTFEIVTNMSGGGDVSWHQRLIMGVEDACVDRCVISTKVMGKCESACNQLHLTCAYGAKTFVDRGGQMLEHATTGDNNDQGCYRCDIRLPKEKCNLCSREEAVTEYKDRCDRLLKGRHVKIDLRRKALVSSYAEDLADRGVFDSVEFSNVLPPWAKMLNEPQTATQQSGTGTR